MEGVLSKGVLSGNGLCLEGVMYGGGFVQGGFVREGVMYGGGFVRGGFVQGGFVRRGFCPRTHLVILNYCNLKILISSHLLGEFYCMETYKTYSGGFCADRNARIKKNTSII